MVGLKPAFSFPLEWPDGAPETKSRRYSQFVKKSTLTAGNGLAEQVRLLGGDKVFITTNCQLSKDRFPMERSMQGSPGVAVYFNLKGKEKCVAVDQYHSVWENTHAIALVIEALRTTARHGGPDMLDRSFVGFDAAALPVRADAVGGWASILNVEPTTSNDAVRAKYRELVRKWHPDVNPDPKAPAEFSAITAAYEQFQKERGLA